jgi:uncharacterized protein (TIGR03435 family)
VLRPALILLSFAPAIVAQPAPKIEFEVASLKASPPRDGGPMFVGCRGGPETKDPVLYTCQNMSLSNFVTFAYDISYYQLTAPEWTKEARFELRAKLPEGSTKDQLKLMMQSLLADRFKLAVHRENRDLSKFDLVVAKSGPKLKAAAEPATPKEPPSADGPRMMPGPPARDKDGYPILSPGRAGMAIMNGYARLYEPAITMSMFAGRIGGQLGKPVTDATGLPGKYEINIFWMAEMMRSGPLGAPPLAPGAAPVPIASTPDSPSGPTLQQALLDQLGLRLEAKKGPVEFLVVDHMEKAPTDN